jgi:outer membrane biosynthesis protein TonB
MFSHSILLAHSPSERQFVDDLTNLCKRHKISCGRPEDITHLGADLASNESFRIDLFTLCTAISHMAEVDLSPEQLLVFVVCAFGGSETSISDVTVDLPQDAMSAFLDGYETWSTREPDPDTRSPWRGDSEQYPVSSRPGPTLFYSAASRSAADLRGTQDDPLASRASNGATPRRHIPANTPLESLTLSELRMYLEDIENRVSRLEPRLERIAPQRFSSPEHIEQPEPLDIQRVPEASSTIAAHSEPAIVPETIVPAHTEPALDTTTSSPLVIPHQDAIVSDISSSATDAVRLRRLRTVNAVLTFLLILVCGSAAIFGYRYLRPQPASSADTPPRSPLPLEQLTSKPTPAAQTAKASQHDAPSAASSIPAPIHHPGNTTSGNAADTHPAQASPTQPTATPASVVTLAPQADAKKPEPSPTPATESPAPQQHSSLPTTAPPTPDNHDHSQARISPSDAQPNPNSAEPEHPSPPATRPSVAYAAPAPSRPAGTPTPASVPHPYIPTNAPVAVPGIMMMTYAVLAPKPIYPSYKHSGLDSAIDVEATISKDGKVTSARALNGALDVRGAAVRAVQEWRFRPFILDGNPVAVVTTFKFVFKAH